MSSPIRIAHGVRARAQRSLVGLAGVSLVSVHSAFGHGFAGPHMFISTLLIDDPNVADEASLPTFIWLPQPNGGGPTPQLYNLNFEFDKRITENVGFNINDGYSCESAHVFGDDNLLAVWRPCRLGVRKGLTRIDHLLVGTVGIGTEQILQMFRGQVAHEAESARVATE